MKEKTAVDLELNHYRSTKGVLDIAQWRSDSGANVLFVKAPSIPMVDIKVVFDAGSARSEKEGLANLANSLIAEGTQELDVDAVANTFDSLGIEFDLGAYRDMALTQIRTLSAKEYITPGVEVLAKILAKPNYPEKAVQREIKNTITALNFEAQSPNQLAQKALYQNLFGDTPYGQWPLGTMQTIKEISRQDLIDFHKKFYVSQNATVVICGDTNLEMAENIANTLTEHLGRGEKAAALPPTQPLKTGNFVQIPFESKQTHIMVGSKGLKYLDKDYFPLFVGNHILGGNGMASRIFNIIRNESGLAYDAHSYFIPMKTQGPFIMGMQTKSEQASKALELLQTTLKGFIKDGPTEEELKAAKENLIRGFPLRFDSNRAITDILAQVGFYDLPIDYYDRYIESIEAVNVEAIKLAFQNRLAPDAMITVSVGPN